MCCHSADTQSVRPTRSLPPRLGPMADSRPPLSPSPLLFVDAELPVATRLLALVALDVLETAAPKPRLLSSSTKKWPITLVVTRLLLPRLLSWPLTEEASAWTMTLFWLVHFDFLNPLIRIDLADHSMQLVTAAGRRRPLPSTRHWINRRPGDRFETSYALGNSKLIRTFLVLQ